MVEFTSLNIHEDAAARRRWTEGGSPSIPYLQVGDEGMSLLHPTQAVSLLGLDAAVDIDLVRLYWDIGSILEGWVDVLRALDWDTLTEPTRSRGRTVLDLLPNAVVPMALIHEAWETGRFHGRWDDLEDKVKETLSDSAAVVAYAERVRDQWFVFGLDHFAEGADHDPPVTDPEKGTVPFSTLLAVHRWHSGFHLRQVILHLAHSAHPYSGSDPTSAMHDLELPDDVFT